VRLNISGSTRREPALSRGGSVAHSARANAIKARARPGNIAHARQLLALPARPKEPETPEAALEQPRALPRPCPCCGSRMIIIETFARGCEPKYRPTPPAAIRIDTS